MPECISAIELFNKFYEYFSDNPLECANSLNLQTLSNGELIYTDHNNKVIFHFIIKEKMNLVQKFEELSKNIK
jgi:hypothetical protein